MKLLAIDPGTEQSAYVIFDTETKQILYKGILPNYSMRTHCNTAAYDSMAIEMMVSYGMPVGREIFETVYYTGMFAYCAMARHIPVRRVTRPEVKRFVTGMHRANDADVRRALINMYGGTKKGGPLEGVVKDIWAALAVATYVSEKK